MKRGRLNVYVSEDIAKWYRDRAKKIGITISPMVSVALSAYKEQMEILDDVTYQSINKMDELWNKSHKIL